MSGGVRKSCSCNSLFLYQACNILRSALPLEDGSALLWRWTIIRTSTLAAASAGSAVRRQKGRNMADIWVGLSGWSYANWRGPLYPPALPSRGRLRLGLWQRSGNVHAAPPRATKRLFTLASAGGFVKRAELI